MAIKTSQKARLAAGPTNRKITPFPLFRKIANYGMAFLNLFCLLQVKLPATE